MHTGRVHTCKSGMSDKYATQQRHCSSFQVRAFGGQWNDQDDRRKVQTFRRKCKAVAETTVVTTHFLTSCFRSSCVLAWRLQDGSGLECVGRKNGAGLGRWRERDG